MLNGEAQVLSYLFARLLGYGLIPFRPQACFLVPHILESIPQIFWRKRVCCQKPRLGTAHLLSRHPADSNRYLKNGACCCNAESIVELAEVNSNWTRDRVFFQGSDGHGSTSLSAIRIATLFVIPHSFYQRSEVALSPALLPSRDAMASRCYVSVPEAYVILFIAKPSNQHC